MATRGARPVLALLAAAALLAPAREAAAQIRSTITGTVRDGARAPLAGVSLTIASRTQPDRARTGVTDARGAYRFAELQAGVYDLTASHPGLQTVMRGGIRLPVGTTLTVDLALRPANGASPDDTIRIDAPGPVVDVTTASSTTTLGTEELENLPVTGTALAYLVPGINVATAFGSSSAGIEWVADGSPITTTGRGSTTTSPVVNVYWIEEAQLGGLGAPAEYGEFGAAFANVAVRSGTDRYSGLVEYRTTRTGWVSDNTGSLPDALRSQFRPQEILSKWTTTLRAGGPIRRGRAFFFAGAEYDRFEVVQSGRIGNIPQDSKRPSGMTKVHWVASPDVRIEGYVAASRTRFTGILAQNALPDTVAHRSRRAPSWNTQISWTLTPSTLLELRYGGIDVVDSLLSGERRAGPPPRFDRVTGINSGNARNFSDRGEQRSVASARLRRFVDPAGGSHELEAGFELERTRFSEVQGIPGNRSFTDASGVPEEVQLWDGDTTEATGRRTTLYVQDAWHVAGGLTVHPGVRIGFNRGRVPDRGAVFETTAISPRVGVAWDLAGDHKTVLRAAYGRLHDGLFPVMYSLMHTAGIAPRIRARVLGPETFQELTRSLAPTNVAIDDGISHAYVDEQVVGLERELAADTSLKIQYVRRRFEDVWAMVDTGSRYERVQRPDPGPDGRLGTVDDGSPLEVFNVLNPGQSFIVLTNPSGAFRRYDAMQLIGQRRFARRWQLLAAYTWSKTRGTVNPTVGANAGLGGLGPDGPFANPNAAINADGVSAFDLTHQAVLRGTYQIPFWGGAAVSASYQYMSGGPWGRVAIITGLRQGNQTVRIEPRGTHRTDALARLDLRIEKTFGLGRSGRTAGVYVDAFNVTNQGIALGVVERSGATFGTPQPWSQPRSVQAAVRVNF